VRQRTRAVLTSLVFLVAARVTADETRGYLGVVFALHTADLAAKAPATVQTVRVRLGDSVKAGQVLVILESNELDQDIAAARAGLWAARADSIRMAAELKQVTSVLDRREKVSGAFTQEEIESLVARKVSASANLESARAKIAERVATLRALEDRKQSLALRAPFSAQVTWCAGTRGEYVSPGQRLVRLASTKDLWVRFAVPSSDGSWLVPGRRVDVLVEGKGSPLRAEIRQVSPEIDSATGMIFAEAAVLAFGTPKDRVPVGSVVRIVPGKP